MASSSESYTFQHGSSKATRALVSDEASSKEPTQQPESSSNYERAVHDRIGLGRQQSWTKDDLKRQATEQMLGGQTAQGYTSTSK